jgi:anti-sigma regulatory factor (Ser/Thr protein kinase)
MAECGQHESLLNVAFDGTPAWRLLCPYDVTGLPGDVLDQARANHPVLLEDHTWGTSPTYHSVLGARALRGRPLPPPAEAPLELAFAEGELGSVRRLVSRACAENGVPDEQAEDLVLAAHEVATNSLLHGGARGVLRVWREPETLVCEVSDEGNITNPLVGRQRPPTEDLGGRGLWLANQLCDLVQVRSGAAGTTVRLHVRRP